MEILENGQCWWNIEFNEETEESTERVEVLGRITGPDHCRRLEGSAPRLSEKTGTIAVRDVLGHELPEGVDVLFDGDKVVPSSGPSLVCVRCEKSWATFGSTRCLHCGTSVCRRRLRRRRKQMVVFAAGGGRVVSRIAERSCGGATGREEGVRPCGTSSSFQGDETAKPEPVLDGSDCSNLKWKLQDGALGHGTVEQSTDESWTAPGRTGVE